MFRATDISSNRAIKGLKDVAILKENVKDT